MPMPQRNTRRVAQLLSNNSLLSGAGASGISTVTGLSNCISSGSNSTNTAANGRLYGHPVAAAGLAGAAAASASALNSISASAHHPQPPPLITDTLTACLDVNGTYICTSYSPRCYIIQKVTPNTVTVTPHVIGGGEASTSTGIVTGGSSQQVVGPSLVPLLPAGSSVTSSLSVRKLVKSSGSGGGGISSSSSSPSHHFNNSSHQSSYNSVYNHQQHHPPHRHFHHHSSHHGNQHMVPGNLSHHRHSFNPQLKTTNTKSGISIEKSTASVLLPTSTSATQSGRAYMNGEVGSTTAAFAGEESIPAMVLQVPTSAGAGIIADNRTLNGLKDGTSMPREQMKSIESNEVENADNSRRSDPGNGATSSDMPKEELKRLLLQQLEYYFSPENLANDKFLVSQMDSDHYVLISTLANFNMVKKLTGDQDLVTEVLRESKNVQVHSDGKRVRPVSHRTVVILRGIPESTPVDEIKALFDSENCPKCNSCEFAFNDSWYVSFESDEDAQRAHRYLREDVKEFKGQPIMARIKSRPTTLLAQGAGVHLKNGFHQPTQVMGTFIPPAFVPGSQTGPTTAVAPTPMYAHGQTVPPVFSLPPNYSYSPWPSFFGMGPEQISQMYPLNGIPPQHQSSSTYPKSLPINSRPRNPNQVRPRRPPPSSSDNQGINGVVGAGGTGSAVAAHQSYGNPPPRKPTNNPPPPLLNLVPNPPTLPLANPTSHNHSQSHMTHSSVQVSGAAISQNGRHFNSLPSSHNADSYHPSSSSSGSMRPYRGVGDSRPRSSLSNRKGPPRRDDEGSYDGPSASPSLSAKVPSTRGAPPTAPVAQPPVETIGPHQHQGKLNFDLEGSAFPPLPGSGQSAGKNGDAMFEGRLSDVVKGVKNFKSTSSEKDDAKPSAGNVPTEIVVSAEENQNFGDVREVSAASPVKDLEVDKKPEHSSSQTYVQSGKKEFREVGVGSADDTHDIRSSHYKSSVVSGGVRGKETADKSTRTDEALLNGDQSQGIVGVKAGGASNSSSQTSVSQNGGNRKSASQTTSCKSPIPGKRAVPALQVQNASSTVSVGPEVPYSSRNVTSPVATTPAKISTTVHSIPGSGNIGSNTGNSAVGRGANAYMAKPNMDNNNSRANGTVSNNNGSNLSSVDKDAFPSPGFGKSVPTCKPFPVSTDQISKEVRTDVEKERKESGQGDGKKGDDCSNDERDGPVRLSYAQVAQARKDAVAVSNSSSHTSIASNNVHTASSPNSTSVPHGFSSSNEEKKKPNPKDTKDPRAPAKNQRGSGGGDRERGGFRRGFRNRMMSDHSDGGSGTSGDSSRRLPKPSRSPK